MARPVLERLAGKIVISDTGCWEFQGCQQRGYGRISWDGRLWLTHRVTYTHLVGPIPDHLELDHLCKNPPCCNPAHLEAVTRSVNVQRGTQWHHLVAKAALITHCPAGHSYDQANTYVTPKGDRQCRACKVTADLRYRSKQEIRERKAAYARAWRLKLKQEAVV